MPLITIKSAPGIQRDGTTLNGDAYADGQWCRFRRGNPKKIGGYRELSRALPDVGRGIYLDTNDATSFVHVGTQAQLLRATLDINTGITSGLTDRTPSGFAVNPNNLWQFDGEFDVGTSKNYILAHAAPNLANIANSVTRPVYFGDLSGTAALTAITGADTSGGIVVLHPYLFTFGSDGYVQWSVAGNPTDFTNAGSGAVRPTKNKLVQGLPLRSGPSNAPAGLFWGLNTVSRITFIGGTNLFSYDTISTSSSILSSQSVIEHNGVYYWPTLSGFLLYTGIIQEIPNTYNQIWFYNNVNLAYRQKVFATKVPLYGEIWWCFPKGMATECDHAIVFNYRENYWYDTPLPNGGRSCAAYEQVFAYPVMTGNQLNSSATPGTPTYSMWQHEFGIDEVSGSPQTTLAVPSRYRTSQITAIEATAAAPGTDIATSVHVVEPDFVMTGNLTMRCFGAANAMVADPPQLDVDKIITPPADGNQDQLPAFTVTQRLLQFEFESNIVGGDYEAGTIIAHVEQGDDRHTG